MGPLFKHILLNTNIKQFPLIGAKISSFYDNICKIRTNFEKNYRYRDRYIPYSEEKNKNQTDYQVDA